MRTTNSAPRTRAQKASPRLSSISTTQATLKSSILGNWSVAPAELEDLIDQAHQIREAVGPHMDLAH